jgi:hypothetical protein
MKKKLTGIIMLIGIFAATAAIANAQLTRQLKTTIPFSFTVGKADLPAGDYVIMYGGVTPSHSSIIVRSADGSRSVMALIRTESVTGAAEFNGITFERVNGRYYLGEVSVYALKIDLGGPKSDAPGLKLAAK